MKHTQKVFVHFSKEGDYVFRAFDSSPYNPDLILVNAQWIEFDVPEDFNPVPAQIKNLESMKAELQRQFAMKVAKINESISKLQCLEFTP